MTRNHSYITQEYYSEGVTASWICTVLHIILDLIQKWFMLFVYVFLLSLSSVQSVISDPCRRLGLRSLILFLLYILDDPGLPRLPGWVSLSSCRAG